MGTKCKICGSDVSDKQLTASRGKRYCSRRCNWTGEAKSYRNGAIGSTFLFIALGLVTGYYTLSGGEYFVYWIGFMFIGPGILIGLVSGAISLIGYDYRREDAEKKGKEERTCIHCGKEVYNPEDKGPVICMNCGKKTPICVICGKIISNNKEIYEMEPCGHMGHKLEILELLETKADCPLCGERIEKIDLARMD